MVVVGVVVGAAVGLNLLGEKLRRPGVLLRPKGRDLIRKSCQKSAGCYLQTHLAGAGALVVVVEVV